MADISVFKVLEGWSKKCRKPCIFIKLSVFGANSTNFDEVLSLNQLYVIEFSAFSTQKKPFISISFNLSVKFVATYVFLGVQFGLKDLICVNNLTFQNSAGVLICEVHFQWTVLKILAVKYIRFLLRNICYLKCS